jgi:hypothetical protein
MAASVSDVGAARCALMIQENNISIGNPTDFLPNDHLDVTLVSHG